ncbi:MAG TPA: flagellar export protein FliJ [Thermotogota bacterium]|nr:flagellar export protein FliJ [Thermotogota bacterium]NLZ13551.1 flagellar export protein FliJ [Thermotogaceae bacterium]MDD8040118.1 flagellar export protein FliJ [Thermotogota bacterium]HNR62660.1 flagellar export protein FliJ [Thermotogota bacterium]HNT94666.1 flagellar export protein FliJ [Thermotogota bacterium]
MQRFLDILNKRLEQKKIELGMISQELRRKEEEITGQKKTIFATQEAFHKRMLSNRILPSELTGYTFYIDSQYETLKKLVRQRVEIERRLERCKEEYIEINRNVQIFEKLKEKKYRAFAEEADLEERKEMDEIAIRRIKKNNLSEAGDNG